MKRKNKYPELTNMDMNILLINEIQDGLKNNNIPIVRRYYYNELIDFIKENIEINLIDSFETYMNDLEKKYEVLYSIDQIIF